MRNHPPSPTRGAIPGSRYNAPDMWRVPAVFVTLLALEGDKRSLVRSATWLFVGLVAIGALGLCMVWFAASAARRRARARRAAARRRVIPDAWAEAGRRAEPEPRDEDEEETGGSSDWGEGGDWER